MVFRIVGLPRPGERRGGRAIRKEVQAARMEPAVRPALVIAVFAEEAALGRAGILEDQLDRLVGRRAASSLHRGAVHENLGRVPFQHVRTVRAREKAGPHGIVVGRCGVKQQPVAQVARTERHLRRRERRLQKSNATDEGTDHRAQDDGGDNRRDHQLDKRKAASGSAVRHQLSSVPPLNTVAVCVAERLRRASAAPHSTSTEISTPSSFDASSGSMTRVIVVCDTAGEPAR